MSLPVLDFWVLQPHVSAQFFKIGTWQSIPQDVETSQAAQDPQRSNRFPVAGQSIGATRLATGLHPMERALQDADAVGALVARTPQHSARLYLRKDTQLRPLQQTLEWLKVND